MRKSSVRKESKMAGRWTLTLWRLAQLRAEMENK